MNLAVAWQVSLKICMTNVEALKINNTIVEIYKIVVPIFSILDKDGKERFFEESFLLADINPDVMLRMSFLTISNVYVDFQAWDL